MNSFTALSTPCQTAPAPTQGPSASAGTGPRVVPSQELLAGQKTVEILHNGLLYRLQATRLGKLILTK